MKIFLKNNRNLVLEIGKLNLTNKSTRKKGNEELNKIYASLIDEMNQNEFIIIR